MNESTQTSRPSTAETVTLPAVLAQALAAPGAAQAQPGSVNGQEIAAASIELISTVGRLLTALGPSLLGGAPGAASIHAGASPLPGEANSSPGPDSDLERADGAALIANSNPGAMPAAPDANVMWGTAQIAEWSGLSPWVVRYTLVKREGFPAPVMLGKRPRWFAEEVRAWARMTQGRSSAFVPRGGRPRKPTNVNLQKVSSSTQPSASPLETSESQGSGQ